MIETQNSNTKFRNDCKAFDTPENCQRIALTNFLTLDTFIWFKNRTKQNIGLDEHIISNFDFMLDKNEKF